MYVGNQKPSMKSLGLATVGSVGFARPVKPKMDLNRALRIMGYTTPRQFLDTSQDPTKEPKKELKNKHFELSMALLQKKNKPQDVRHNKGDRLCRFTLTITLYSVHVNPGLLMFYVVLISLHTLERRAGY